MKKLMQILAVTALPMSAAADVVDPFENLIVFGDSLSDAGQFGLQFTDGDTWAVQLGADLASGRNVAFGGARATANPGTGDGQDFIPDFAEQIGIYTARPAVPLSDALAAIWFGGNDLLAAANDLPNALTIVAQAASDIGDNTLSLFSQGVRDFILIKLPDLGAIPRLVGTPGESLGRDASAAINGAIDQLAGALTAGGANVTVIDVPAIFAGVAADPAGAGFTSLTETCNSGTSCDGLFFWDDIHPTAAAHTIIADNVRLAIDPIAPVPLPAAGWLMIAGLGGIAAMQRRKRVADRLV